MTTTKPTEIIAPELLAFSEKAFQESDEEISVYLHQTGGYAEIQGGELEPQTIFTLPISKADVDWFSNEIIKLDAIIDLDFSISTDIDQKAASAIRIFHDTVIDVGSGDSTLGIALSNTLLNASPQRWWELVLNTPQFVGNDQRRFATLHEFGHSLGLEHPFEASDGDVSGVIFGDPDSSVTIMSYTEAASGWPSTFTPLDYAALALIWGLETDSSEQWLFYNTDGSSSLLSRQQAEARLSLNRPEEALIGPFLELSFSSGTTAEDLEENTPVEKVIYTASVNARNSDFGTVVYALADDAEDDSDHFQINSITGEVRLNTKADHENKSRYTFTVTAEDGVNPPARQQVTLAILDLDESRPIFDSAVSASVSENSGANQQVYRAEASDTGDVSAGVTYRLLPLSGDQSDDFIINRETGVVTLRENPDFESRSSYQFSIEADDGVTEPTQITVTLTVDNVDEAPPQFISDSVAKVIEHSGANTRVYIAKAIDNRDVSAGVRYELAQDGTDDSDNFAIDSKTGEVRLTINPDHELQSSYQFTVIADDGKTAATSKQVTLEVIDKQELKASTQLQSSLADNDSITQAGLVGFDDWERNSAPLTPEAINLLRQYNILPQTSAITGNKQVFSLQINPNSDANTDSIITLVNLDEQISADGFIALDPITGKASDFTYDPISDQGVELLDQNNDGLVDALRVHLDTRTSLDGVLGIAPRQPIHRLFNQATGAHFYTPSEAEKDTVIANTDWGYTYEGIAYQALDTQGRSLYRFYNAAKRYHFLSTSLEEAANVIANSYAPGIDPASVLADPEAYKDQLINGGWGYTYEGTTYNVSTIPQHGMDTTVHRFFNPAKGVHFYSASTEEANTVIAQSLGDGYDLNNALNQSNLIDGGWGYVYEGSAWFV